MSLLETFVWWRDPQKGFTINEARREPNPNFGKEVPPLKRWGLLGEFEVRTDTESEFFRYSARVLRGKSELEAYVPAQKYRGHIILRKFATIDSSPGMVGFVNEFGPLTQSGLEHGEAADEGFELARKARDLLRAHRDQDYRTIKRELGSRLELQRRVTAFMVPDTKSGARLQLELSDLFSFIWFQLSEALAGDKPSLCECRYCGKWFEVGPDSPGKKKKGSEYCKPEHKNAYHNPRRTKGN